MTTMSSPLPEAVDALAMLRASGWTIATAESLTGGLVCAALTAIPGASATVRGGVVAYGREQKVRALGVDDALIERVGTVDPDVALAMARGVCAALDADVGVATTGVAGPEAHSGHEPGEVVLAVVSPRGSVHEQVSLGGDREQVRADAVAAALRLVVTHLRTP